MRRLPLVESATSRNYSATAFEPAEPGFSIDTRDIQDGLTRFEHRRLTFGLSRSSMCIYAEPESPQPPTYIGMILFIYVHLC